MAEQNNAIEMFPLLGEGAQLHVCQMCGAVVLANKRDEHWRFHSIAGGALPTS